VPDLSPEQQIAYLRASIAYLRGLKRHQGKAEAIRDAEQQLAELEAQHALGLLLPLRNDDGCPF
jgi:hypothetical protein